MRDAITLLVLFIAVFGCKASSPASAQPESGDAPTDGCEAVSSCGRSVEERFDAVVGDRRPVGGTVFLIGGDRTRIDRAIASRGLVAVRARTCPGALTMLFVPRLADASAIDFEHELASSPGDPTDVVERHYIPWRCATARSGRAPDE